MIQIDWMYIIPLVLIMLAMLFIISYAMNNKTLYDKILAANIFGTLAILLVLVIQFFKNTEAYLDIALAYALINFIMTVALLKLFCDPADMKVQNSNEERDNQELAQNWGISDE